MTWEDKRRHYPPHAPAYTGNITTDRYPAPARADLVTLWKRGQEPVLSIAADGKVQDFHLPPARLVVLLRELADLLAENTVLK